MDETACPLPAPLDPQRALAKLAEVQRRRAALSRAAQERFAARELGVEVPVFRAALKGENAIPSPRLTVPKRAAATDDPIRHAYDAGWQASKTTRTFDLDAAEYRYEKKYGRSQRADFAAGWADYASGYNKYENLRTSATIKPTL